MSAQHTQGLLAVNPTELDQITAADTGKEIARATHFGHSVDTIIANARRLAACWNACDGISTDDLDRYYGCQAGIDAALEEASLQYQLSVVVQRNELLEALELDHLLLSGANMNRSVVNKKVLSAIAKAKGGSA
ncbi:hypothetical protein [Malikia sp.]|uniref:hypothetical protein n=1 Tax=Malikia sp. TaxID=2070706 RepID=UPI00260AC3C9|nr:hypothetical protein [Malikia sp.]MDD2728298.1 hypothetical protein [Malikia sp.]